MGYFFQIMAHSPLLIDLPRWWNNKILSDMCIPTVEEKPRCWCTCSPNTIVSLSIKKYLERVWPSNETVWVIYLRRLLEFLTKIFLKLFKHVINLDYFHTSSVDCISHSSHQDFKGHAWQRSKPFQLSNSSQHSGTVFIMVNGPLILVATWYGKS